MFFQVTHGMQASWFSHGFTEHAADDVCPCVARDDIFQVTLCTQASKFSHRLTEHAADDVWSLRRPQCRLPIGICSSNRVLALAIVYTALFEMESQCEV
jgi:hypothetical protein